VLALRAALDTQRDNGAAYTDPVAVSRYLARDFRAALETAKRAVADALPALAPEDFRRLCNGDAAVREEVTAWRDRRWNMVDVSELAGTGEDDTDGETWTVLRGWSRFVVREVPRYEVRAAKVGHYVHDNESNDEHEPSADVFEATGVDPEESVLGPDTARALVDVCNEDSATVYLVWDTEAGGDARDGDRYGPFVEYDIYDATDEDDATRAAEGANIEDYRANANGWPFAWNTAAAIDKRDADDFAAAGFVVATHEPSGQTYAGIDGGGYDFLEAHWSRLYLACLLFGKYAPACIYVPTADGLRRVVRGE
jgi:hypothetical protein